MEKTINILKKEFETNLVNLIEQSEIPACILQDIFEKYLHQLTKIAQESYQRDLKKLKEQQNKSSNELSQ